MAPARRKRKLGGGVRLTSFCPPPQDLFQRHEGVLRDGEKVLQILPGSVVTVTTDRGKYRAKRLVVTAGAWTNQLLAPLGLQLPLQVRTGRPPPPKEDGGVRQ